MNINVRDTLTHPSLQRDHDSRLAAPLCTPRRSPHCTWNSHSFLAGSSRWRRSGSVPHPVLWRLAMGDGVMFFATQVEPRFRVHSGERVGGKPSGSQAHAPESAAVSGQAKVNALSMDSPINSWGWVSPCLLHHSGPHDLRPFAIF